MLILIFFICTLTNLHSDLDPRPSNLYLRAQDNNALNLPLVGTSAESRALISGQRPRDIRLKKEEIVDLNRIIPTTCSGEARRGRL
ncbi:hypothetical protein V8E51_010911 [Hyaloscypha variabilis]